MDRAGLDLGEVEASGAEGFERTEEGARAVLERERNAELVGIDWRGCRGGNQGEEAGVVVGMVFDAG